MIVKQAKDHNIINSPICGEIREILTNDEYTPNIAIALDIGETKAHFHRYFDEVYFVLDGSLTLKLYDPQVKETTELTLGQNELCVITKGIHHKVIKASSQNRLCVLTIPKFNREDEILSGVL
jgi:mannose-6-phosphate isomerase-like protein (cupin superfamily)